MPDEPFVSAAGVRKAFGQVEVLHGVDLDLHPGVVTALLGENGAGKSTLVKILAGDYTADAGRITIGDRPATNVGIQAVRGLGLRIISQEFADAPTLSVAENIMLGAWPRKGAFVDHRRMRTAAIDVLAELGSDLDPDVLSSSLRLGERQLVEIARAMVGENRCLILDEPTAALSDAEAQQLFAVIARLKAKGVAVLYITHRLDEVFAIADRVVVLRDGVVALESDTASVAVGQVIEAMVGRAVEFRRYARDPDAEQVGGGLEIVDATDDGFTDVSLEFPRGQVTALYGKVGSGVSELAEALFGARPLTRGHLSKDGRRLSLHSPNAAIREGIGFLPADRKHDAIFPVRSVAENLAAPSWPRLSSKGFLTGKVDARAYRRWHEPLNIRSRNDPAQTISTLSGGNQQKVLLGRWLEQGSDILVLSEPTRGVDVGARQDIYQTLRALADRGTAVVIASSDYEDITSVADIAHIFIRGRLVATLADSEITVDSLSHAAGGALHAQ